MGANFFLKAILLGVGLAMDAFSVSLANGLNEPCMKKRKMCGVALIFALFQFLMPMIGWVCVSFAASQLKAFETAVPWIALFLLLFIGGKMLIEGIKNRNEPPCVQKTGISALLIQGVATSIDALSVGFTIADYKPTEALISCLMIGAVTFLICLLGVIIGRKAGVKLAGKASIFGGVILIAIGIEIFLTGIL